MNRSCSRPIARPDNSRPPLVPVGYTTMYKRSGCNCHWMLFPNCNDFPTFRYSWGCKYNAFVYEPVDPCSCDLDCSCGPILMQITWLYMFVNSYGYCLVPYMMSDKLSFTFSIPGYLYKLINIPECGPVWGYAPGINPSIPCTIPSLQCIVPCKTECNVPCTVVPTPPCVPVTSTSQVYLNYTIPYSSASYSAVLPVTIPTGYTYSSISQSATTPTVGYTASTNTLLLSNISDTTLVPGSFFNVTITYSNGTCNFIITAQFVRLPEYSQEEETLYYDYTLRYADATVSQTLTVPISFTTATVDASSQVSGTFTVTANGTGTDITIGTTILAAVSALDGESATLTLNTTVNGVPTLIFITLIENDVLVPYYDYTLRYTDANVSQTLTVPISFNTATIDSSSQVTGSVTITPNGTNTDIVINTDILTTIAALSGTTASLTLDATVNGIASIIFITLIQSDDTVNTIVPYYDYTLRYTDVIAQTLTVPITFTTATIDSSSQVTGSVTITPNGTNTDIVIGTDILTAVSALDGTSATLTLNTTIDDVVSVIFFTLIQDDVIIQYYQYVQRYTDSTSDLVMQLPLSFDTVTINDASQVTGTVTVNQTTLTISPNVLASVEALDGETGVLTFDTVIDGSPAIISITLIKQNEINYYNYSQNYTSTDPIDIVVPIVFSSASVNDASQITNAPSITPATDSTTITITTDILTELNEQTGTLMLNATVNDIESIIFVNLVYTDINTYYTYTSKFADDDLSGGALTFTLPITVTGLTVSSSSQVTGTITFADPTLTLSASIIASLDAINNRAGTLTLTADDNVTIFLNLVHINTVTHAILNNNDNSTITTNTTMPFSESYVVGNIIYAASLLTIGQSGNYRISYTIVPAAGNTVNGNFAAAVIVGTDENLLTSMGGPNTTLIGSFITPLTNGNGISLNYLGDDPYEYTSASLEVTLLN